VLAPDHVGWTFEEQPTLWWYLSGRADARIDIAVIDDTSTEPLLAVTVSPPLEGGMRSLHLAEHGLRLEPGRTYQWFVTLVSDPARRSNDVIASDPADPELRAARATLLEEVGLEAAARSDRAAAP
jgi:hypothetical protein